MTSAWLTAAITSFGCLATSPSRASTARSCIPRIDSPCGKPTSEGRCCTTGQTLVRATDLSGRSVHLPYSTSRSPSTGTGSKRCGAATAAAVSAVRGSGLV